jgi:hypothetical protein
LNLRGFVRNFKIIKEKNDVKNLKERKPTLRPGAFGVGCCVLGTKIFCPHLKNNNKKNFFLRPTRGARVDTKHTHTHATLVYYLTRVIGAAHFLLFPLLLFSAHFFYSHLNFNRKRIALNGAIDSITPDIIIDETKLFSHQLKLKLVRYGHKANGKKKRNDDAGKTKIKKSSAIK